MLGSPVLSPLGVDRPALRAVRSVARLGDIGLPGMFSTYWHKTAGLKGFTDPYRRFREC